MALTTADLMGMCREFVRRTCGEREGQGSGGGGGREAAGPLGASAGGGVFGMLGGVGAGGGTGGVAMGAHGAWAAATGGGDGGGEGGGGGAVPARSTALLRDVFDTDWYFIDSRRVYELDEYARDYIFINFIVVGGYFGRKWRSQEKGRALACSKA